MARGPVFHVGTSGWCYAHWRKRLYPHSLPSGDWLPYYARFFSTVELNATFYRLAPERNFQRWAKATPERFLFAVKASRFLTHIKKLNDPQEPIERLLSRASGLGPKLGPLLYQLPPTMHRDDSRLTQFLKALPRGYKHVIEFRNSEWYADDVLDLLRTHGIGFCIHDWKRCPSPLAVTASFAYVRLHGTRAPFIGSYSALHLRSWRDRLLALESQDLQEIYVYFNNDVRGYAVRNAVALKAMLPSAREAS